MSPWFMRLGGCVVALLALLAAPTVAAAAWSAPFNVSAAGQDGAFPQVAVDADGDAIFTWYRSDGTNLRIEARSRSAAGALGPVQTLSAAGHDAFNPQVAVDADGDAVFVWERFDGTNYRAQTRSRSAAGALSAVQTLSAAGQNVIRPQVAADDVGDAVFTWARSDGTDTRIQARARDFSSETLSSVQNLSAAGQDAGIPQVGVDANGDAVFTWQRSDGANGRVQARTRAVAGTLGSVKTLSDSGQNGNDPQVAVDDAGDALVTWWRSNGTNFRIQTRSFSAAGILGAVENLSAAGEDALYPQVAVDADGDAVFTWQRDDGTPYRAQGRARSTAGILSGIQNLSTAGEYASEPDVGIDADGDAVFIWTSSDGTLSIDARTRSAAGVLGAIETLSNDGHDAYSGHVAVDSDGDAVASWQRSDGTNERVQGAAGP